ncbi:alpha/beta-hydrolase [Cylindrobasidium torrendii FP15055 ss-10]|uniref:sn-1-specific diacylglycerol lipase n=1 Tax=Cylindrobasidium torrendii FP15055 ss-10 TaxID=1314674 RepID=A0A0D7BQ43_9AGAR|nr:alpha/beta-hydrolase [Cylindrobasidium torrendii FP15055 ss-10]
MASWDFYTRQSLDLASSAAAFGFGAAKASTRLGFHVTRGILTTAGTVVDTAFFGGQPTAAAALSGAVSVAEQLALGPLFLGEYVTATSITAAHSSVNALGVIFPGSHEASFSLISFLDLAKQEWAADTEGGMPEKKYTFPQITRGVVGWVSLQGVTREWQETNFFKHLKEIHVREAPRSVESLRARRGSRVRVTSDVIFPGEDRAQIIAADIGEARARSLAFRPSKPRPSKLPFTAATEGMSNAQLKATLRRLSKMVLYGYGGASLLFFGVPLTPPPTAPLEEAQLARAINASEREADPDLSARDPPQSQSESADGYSWWDVLLGKHDEEIFNTHNKKSKISDVVIGQEHLMPRFWVLTDHSRNQVVLVIRGTMSLNEIAVDLTCDVTDFTPARMGAMDPTPVPGRFAFPTVPEEEGEGDSAKEGAKPETYQVHSGILRMAKAMGDIGRPVQVAVQEALFKNPDYDLVMCGHSLGAGVAAMLGLMWSDPSTCLTVPSSGLPVGRRTSVYCFAPPCIADVPLALKAKDLVVSFVYSHDVVARLSIGSVTDIRNAAAWLCEAHQNQATGESAGESGSEGTQEAAEFGNCGHFAVTQKAWRWSKGWGREGDEAWFIALRKTLEANMQHPKKLYPPGRLLWALRDSDLCEGRSTSAAKSGTSRTNASEKDKLRLFEVEDREKTFSQILFAKDMLSSHLPHKYDEVLHDLL